MRPALDTDPLHLIFYLDCSGVLEYERASDVLAFGQRMLEHYVGATGLITSVIHDQRNGLSVSRLQSSNFAHPCRSWVISDPFNVALRCPIIPRKRISGTAGIYEYTPGLDRFLRRSPLVHLR